MVAQTLDGTATAKVLKAELRERVQQLKDRGIVPGLATVLVGDDPGSRWYVAGKHKDCAEIGMDSIRIDLPEETTEQELLAEIAKLNEDEAVTGFIVQLPLPKHIDTDRILEAIDPAKDADGLHPFNLGKLVLNANTPLSTPLPCTPRAVIELVERHGISWQGKHVVVIGRGITVGRPLGPLLTRREYNSTVTLTHTGTPDLGAVTRTADIIVAAAGVKGIVTAEMVSEQAVVLDVGVSREIDPETGKSRVVGDLALDVFDKAAWASPNPGGVGPMTRALLLQNVVEAAERLFGAE